MRLRLFSFLAALFLGILLTAGIVYAEEIFLSLTFPFLLYESRLSKAGRKALQWMDEKSS